MRFWQRNIVKHESKTGEFPWAKILQGTQSVQENGSSEEGEKRW
jgi:hypothetical protein